MLKSLLIWVVFAAVVGPAVWFVMSLSQPAPSSGQAAAAVVAAKRNVVYARRAPPGGSATDPAQGVPPELALKQVVQLNANAHIPPQCYTKTTDDAGRVHNPCYTCHVSSRAPNYINDSDLQLSYSFAPHALKNEWTNLFVDWRPKIANISDEAIERYVRTSNYFDERGEIVLARVLAQPPRAWDFEADGKWAGYIADARFAFDAEGFDRLPDGGYSGWRAYAYYPAPGTFWPTNGSIGDVLIRLPDAFRRDEEGGFDPALYALNLAILEALIARRDVAIAPADEAPLGVDLDGDGALARARVVRFARSAGARTKLSYVGQARLELERGLIHFEPGLFPEGTEFLHSVRYLEPTPTGVQLAARLKELRYARKFAWFTPEWLERRALSEAQDKLDAPAERRAFGGNIEHGIDTGQGWRFQGFIEDAQGALRPQTFEESVYCAGCHGGVGATDDGIFSFGRKLGSSAFQRGWFHWSQHGLQGVKDRRLPHGRSEYAAYLEHNGAGDEFRQNAEVAQRFFRPDGSLRPEMKARLRRDVTSVLLPGRKRALAIDKAYRALVEQQSFRLGREIVLEGARNVHRQVAIALSTGIREPVPPFWQEAGQASRPRD